MRDKINFLDGIKDAVNKYRQVISGGNIEDIIWEHNNLQLQFNGVQDVVQTIADISEDRLESMELLTKQVIELQKQVELAKEAGITFDNDNAYFNGKSPFLMMMTPEEYRNLADNINRRFAGESGKKVIVDFTNAKSASDLIEDYNNLNFNVGELGNKKQAKELTKLDVVAKDLKSELDEARYDYRTPNAEIFVDEISMSSPEYNENHWETENGLTYKNVFILEASQKFAKRIMSKLNLISDIVFEAQLAEQIRRRCKFEAVKIEPVQKIFYNHCKITYTTYYK